MLDMCYSNIMGLKSTGVPLKLSFFAYVCQEFLLIDIPKMNSSSINRSLPSGVTSFITRTHGFPWLSIGPSSWKNWTVTHLDPIPFGRTQIYWRLPQTRDITFGSSGGRDRKTGKLSISLTYLAVIVWLKFLFDDHLLTLRWTRKQCDCLVHCTILQLLLRDSAIWGL